MAIVYSATLPTGWRKQVDATVNGHDGKRPVVTVTFSANLGRQIHTHILTPAETTDLAVMFAAAAASLVVIEEIVT